VKNRKKDILNRILIVLGAGVIIGILVGAVFVIIERLMHIGITPFIGGIVAGAVAGAVYFFYIRKRRSSNL
jgi:hypothetical protein